VFFPPVPSRPLHARLNPLAAGCRCILRAGMKRAHEMAGSTHAVVRCKSNQMRTPVLFTLIVGTAVPCEGMSPGSQFLVGG
jgi:hypothetical protein